MNGKEDNMETFNQFLSSFLRDLFSSEMVYSIIVRISYLGRKKPWEYENKKENNMEKQSVED